MDGGEEISRGLVVARGDGPELLELAEEILDQVTRFIEMAVIRTRGFAVGAGGDDGRLAGLLQRFDYPFIGIEGLVGDHDGGVDFGKQQVGAVEIMGIAGSEREAGWIAERIDGGIDLGGQPAFAAPDRFVAPFFGAPALCWWARTTVLSIIAYSLSGSAAKCSNICSQTPVLAQRLKRRCVLFQSPKRSGRSRQGAPQRYRHSTASTNSRLSLAFAPTWPSRPGSKSLIRSH